MNNIKVFWNRYGLLVVAVLLLLTPQFTSQYEFYVVQRGVQNAMLVLGLVMLIGYTGLMTLGSAALLATGAYTYGILMLRLGCSPSLEQSVPCYSPPLSVPCWESRLLGFQGRSWW